MTKIQKHHVGVLVEKNAFIDEGDGKVIFPKGLPITDSSVQRNGTSYDIATMDISEYKGQVTANHIDTLENIIAKVEGVEKTKNKVLVKSIQYAVKENPLARLAYNLLVNGFSTDFSIETYGPYPGDEGIYMNSKLIGLSQVVVGNNKGAAVNAIVKNSLEQSKEDGLDTAEVEKLVETEIETTISAEHTDDTPAESKEAKESREAEETAKQAEIEAEAKKAAEEAKALKDKEQKENNNKKENEEMKFVTIKNSRDFAVVVKYKNASGEEVETTLEPAKTVDVSEDQQAAVETQVKEAEAPRDEEAEKAATDAARKAEEKAENALSAAVKSAISPLQGEYQKLKEAFDKLAEEPKFVPADKKGKTDNKFADMGYKERHGKQINAAWEYLKLGRIESATVLNEINEVNLEALKADKKVENSMSISDFGNFVISPELLTEIQGYRTDYSAVIAATDWRETLSLEFAWMKRSGDINMTGVDLEPGEDGDGNLKPISEYTAEPQVSKLEELAAVTPVCNAATRFLAVDLLSDVARGYRNDYDRKRAQLFVARLEQAVDANPTNSIDYTVGVTAESLVAWSQLWTKVAETTVNGTFVFNTATFSVIQQAAVQAGSNGPLANIFVTGAVPSIFGRPYIVVPNELMPTLNTGETKTFVVEGANVVIQHAVFYLDLNNFTGRTSGGLQYDLSTEAAYEVNGVVKSAYQRNELVLRGSFFRGGAVLDDARVSGMTSAVAPVVS